MTALAGLFLIAHGLVHLAVWLPPPPPDAPFDSHRSWLVGEAPSLTRAHAMVACVVLALAGILVLAGAGLAVPAAVAAAAVSQALIILTFNRWFVIGTAINVAIVVIALA